MTSAKRPKAIGAVRRAAEPCAKGAEVWSYLDGELPAARARAVAGHLQTCATCAAFATKLRALLEACRVAGCQPLPAPVRARAKARSRALVRSR